MRKLFVFLIGSLLMTGCISHDIDSTSQQEKISENVKSVFGVEFDKNHDWCTTTNGSVKINNIPSDVKSVKLLSLINETDTTTSMVVLNSTTTVVNGSVTLTYDAPKNNNGLYLSLDGAIKPIKGESVDATVLVNAPRRSITRGTDGNSLVIAAEVESYANKRNWNKGEVLYEMSDEAYDNEAIAVEDYDDEYKELFRYVIFSYFKNGRQYNNLPLIKESGYFNDKVYPITTGDEPIIVSPVYKSDKAKQYGNEIYNSDLYYYYYKESDLKSYTDNGGNETDFLKNLPKFKVIPFNKHFGETEDDVISKRASYKLIYWGDEKPSVGTEGTYEFPSGYKIGFMVRANTTYENGKKQGELYGDGRLNNKINSYGNFTSSKLGSDGPRMGWITLNNRMLACCESGTDSDFNDIIFEVEGGVEEIDFIPEFENNVYTFCFEDRELGDYDMNDVVIKATRIDDTTIEYSVIACGANDRLFIFNINGNKINKDTEIHMMFMLPNTVFINTVEADEKQEYVTEQIKVSNKFSFLDESTQPYLYDATTGRYVYLSKKGEDPHGIMIPYDFKYPTERTCIKDAYEEFNSWGENRITSNGWYKKYVEGKVYLK